MRRSLAAALMVLVTVPVALSISFPSRAACCCAAMAAKSCPMRKQGACSTNKSCSIGTPAQNSSAAVPLPPFLRQPLLVRGEIATLAARPTSEARFAVVPALHPQTTAEPDTPPPRA